MDSSKSLEEKIRKMQPLIVMGMHRSGTSLIVRLLSDLGVHMGTRLSRDAEAIHFQKINRRIYKSVGSTWGEIDALLKAIHSEAFIQEQTGMVLDALFRKSNPLSPNPGIADYFGSELWNLLSQGKTVSWGWKDPRTTITFPIWASVFPRARYLHVLRNGIDVAISTHRRSQKQQRKFWKRIFPLDYEPTTLDFEYCFRLWEKHISFILDNKGIIPSGQYMELCYEDLLARAEEKLREISDFIGFPIQEDVLMATCQQINRSRLNNADYASPYQDQIGYLASSPLMQQFGYSYHVIRQDQGVEIER